MLSAVEFCDWLSETPVSYFFQSAEWIVPAVQSIHILAIAVVMGSAMVVDMRLLGVAGRRQTISGMTRYFPWIWFALVVLLLSGSILIIVEPRRELLNPVFQAKMALLLISIALTAALQVLIRRRQKVWDASNVPSSAKLFALVSVILWVAIVVSGRWIAYVEHG